MAQKQNTNSGWPNIDVTEILYYADYTNNNLYLGVKGKLNTGSDNGIGIWLNFSGSGSPQGTSAGNSLGGIPGAGHYMGNTANPNFKADFEVDYMFSINPGQTSINCHVDAASRVGTPAGVYLGNCGQSGLATNYTITRDSVFSSGYTITFAFNNSGSSNTGFEIKIPFGAIGVTSSMSIQAFAFIVSNTAYFSNVTVPGNIPLSYGNLGFNPNFNSLPNGPYHSDESVLPVETSKINLITLNNSVILTWSTTTEVQNYGWEIERSKIDKATNKPSNWQSIGFVKGSGNSNSSKEYSFIDNSALYGEYAYRLKQIDIDGTTSYSDELRISVGQKPQVYDIKPFPNPFNPKTKIRFELPEPGNVKLEIYDLTGKYIQSIVNEYLEEGVYEKEFDASNLSSGIYFTILNVNGQKITKKIQLIK